MEEDLKLSKVEYISNCLLDHTQVLNLDLGDQSKVLKQAGLSRATLEISSAFSSKFTLRTQDPYIVVVEIFPLWYFEFVFRCR